MLYLLTPLNTHIDFGFGVTGEAFKSASDQLDNLSLNKRHVMHEQLPINFLRRHAIELFLKSAIVIIHRSLQMPYGDIEPSGEPHALIDGKWEPLKKLHSLKLLWSYLSRLFQENKSFFDSIKQVNWTFPLELESWIETIEASDPRSTYFRYPTPADAKVDQPKDLMVEGSTEEIMNQLTKHNLSNGKGQFVLLFENEINETMHGYYETDDVLGPLNDALKQCADLFLGIHTAFRMEICGGL